MSRDILVDSSKINEAIPTSAVVRQSDPQVQQPPQRDALAGALPSWDLVPQNQFIRRVK